MHSTSVRQSEKLLSMAAQAVSDYIFSAAVNQLLSSHFLLQD